MTDDSGPSETLPPIDLAREADFRLGATQVRPSSREVERAGNREALEPRVMQVLVALFRADGAVVSRDALIAQCWEGRIVGEDAINRAIGRLRRLSEADDGNSFGIETIARVGYRLTLARTPAAVPATGDRLPTDAAPPPDPSRKNLAIAFVLGIALVALAGGAAAWWYLSPAQWTIDTFKVVVSTPLYENDPALSPNGAMIAYAAGPAPYAWHIFLRNLSDGQPIQLTNGAEDDDMQPAWSPDGDRIAFIRHHENTPCAIVIKPVPAGDEHIVGRCRQDDFSTLAWSPQGDALYFSDRPNEPLPRRIMRLDLASGGVRALTAPPGGITGDYEPAVSPDGKSLVFIRSRQGSEKRLLLNLDDGTLQPTSGDMEIGGLHHGQAWLDATTFIATAGGLTTPSLWLYHGAEPPQRLAFNPQEFGRISGGANGDFAIEIFHNQTVLAAPPDDDSGTPRVVEATTGVSEFPDFAADGRLAFAHADPGGAWEVWVQNPGERPHQLTALNALYIRGVRWSPDGAKLVFYAATGTRSSLHVINADGTGLQSLWPVKAGPGLPAWTADSQGLIYAVPDSHGWRLWRAALAHPERAIPVSDYGWFSVRTVGDAIYASGSRAPGVWRLDGAPRLVAKLPLNCTYPFVPCQAWFVSGDMLVYADHGVRIMPRLVFHSLKDGTEHSVPAPAINVSDMAALDPKTGKLVYVYDGLGDSDIALFHLARR